MKHTYFLKTLCVLFALCFAFGGTAFSAPIENSASTQAAAENARCFAGTEYAHRHRPSPMALKQRKKQTLLQAFSRQTA